MFFHSCDGFGFLLFFFFFLVRGEVPIYAAPPEHRQKALAKVGLWDGCGGQACAPLCSGQELRVLA